MAAAPPTTTHVAVVVLGDIGRSPRMQYHCASLTTLPGVEVRTSCKWVPTRMATDDAWSLLARMTSLLPLRSRWSNGYMWLRY